tara:strand:- start:868 stop:6813 length:5946 start_codon:yes stop_codon:yes gene_type:complete
VAGTDEDLWKGVVEGAPAPVRKGTPRRNPAISTADLEKARKEAVHAAMLEGINQAAIKYSDPTIEQIKAEQAAAVADVERRAAIVTEAGRHPSEARLGIGESRWELGTDKVRNLETGQLDEASIFETLTEPHFARRLGSTEPLAEAARQMQAKGEAPSAWPQMAIADWARKKVATDTAPPAAEAAGDWMVSALTTATPAGIKESGLAAGMRFLGAVSPWVMEPIFGNDALFYEMDAEGNPENPDAFAYRVEQQLLTDEYKSQGMLIKGGGRGKPGPPMLLPRPFQGINRTQGERATTDMGFMVDVANAANAGRFMGDEFLSLPQYKKSLEDLEVPHILGMHPAMWLGMIAEGALIPTPLQWASTLAKPVRGGAAALGAAAKSTKAGKAIAGSKQAQAALSVADTLSSPLAYLKKKGVEAAARDVLGVKAKGPDLQSIRRVAVSAVADQIVTPADLYVTAQAALARGDQFVDPEVLLRRFAGSDAAKRLVDLSTGPDKKVSAKLLMEWSEAAVHAPVWADALKVLNSATKQSKKKVTLELIKKHGRLFPRGTKKALDENPAILGTVLTSLLRASGAAPNTAVPFIRRAYSVAEAALKAADREGDGNSVEALLKVGGLLDREIFNKHVTAALIEEAMAASGEVNRRVVDALRKGVTAENLIEAATALGSDASSAAVEALRRTIGDIANDRILQALPDDYVILTPRTIVHIDKAKEVLAAGVKAKEELFQLEGTVSSQVVVPAAGSTMDDVVVAFVRQVGPEAVRKSDAVTGIIKKLLEGAPLDYRENRFFNETMLDFVVKNMDTHALVTSGGQTAASRSGQSAIRNLGFWDPASKAHVGTFARAAAAGSAGASLLVDDVVMAVWPQNKWAKAVSSFAVDRRSRAYYGGAGAAPAALDEALRASMDAIGNAKIVVERALSAASKGKSGGFNAYDDVARAMLRERSDLAKVEFFRSVNAEVEATSITLKDAAFRHADRLLSGTTGLSTARHKAGSGVLDALLAEAGTSRIALEAAPAREVVEILADVVTQGRAVKDRLQLWDRVLQLMVPGKGADLLANADIRAAINRIIHPKGFSGDVIDITAANLKTVMTEVGKNHPDLISNSLRYLGSGIPAWQQGFSAFLIQTRAGMDAAVAFSRVIDENPGSFLNMMPRVAGEAARGQATALATFIQRIQEIELRFLGVSTPTNKFVRAMGPGADKDDHLYVLMRAVSTFINKIDMSLSDDGRASLVKGFHEQVAAQGTMVPDLGFLNDDMLGAMIGAATKVGGGVRQVKGGTPALKIEVADLLGRYEMDPALVTLLEGAEPMGKAIPDVLHEAVIDALYGSLLSATNESMLSPLYRQYTHAMERWGWRVVDGYSIPSGGRNFNATQSTDEYGRQVTSLYGQDMGEAVSNLNAAVASGRLQATLDDLALAGEVARKETNAGVAAGLLGVSFVQTLVRGMRSSVLAGGGLMMGVIPHVRYLMQNQTSAFELMVSTVGAWNTLQAAKHMPVAVASTARDLIGALPTAATKKATAALDKATSIMPDSFGTAVKRAMLPQSPDTVVFTSPLYGKVTAAEFDMVVATENIMMSRASVENYSGAATELIRAAKGGGMWSPDKPPPGWKRFWRQVDLRNKPIWMQLAEAQDNTHRKAVLAGAVATGSTWDEGAALARESLLDYGKVSAGQGKSGSAERFLQRWLMFWSFKRQSAIATMNALADGQAGLERGELLLRQTRALHRQKQSAAPEEYMYGQAFLGLRAAIVPVEGHPGVVLLGPAMITNSNLSDMMEVSMISGEFMAGAVQAAGGDLDGGPARSAAALKRAGEFILKQNLSPGLDVPLMAMLMAGRSESRGPLVPDVVMAQMATADQLFPGSRATFIGLFGMQKDTNEEGKPVVSPNRPTLAAGPNSQPYQLRFKTVAGYVWFEAWMAVFAHLGASRTLDEATKTLLTLGQFAPEGYQARYRALANTILFMSGVSTPARVEGKDEQLQKLKVEQLRQYKRP